MSIKYPFTYPIDGKELQIICKKSITNPDNNDTDNEYYAAEQLTRLTDARLNIITENWLFWVSETEIRLINKKNKDETVPNAFCIDIYPLIFERENNSTGSAIYKYIKEKEKEQKMPTNNNKPLFKFDFGPCDTQTLCLSFLGLAIKNSNNEWVNYNPKTKEITSVDGFCFDNNMPSFCYKIPTPITDIKVGDIVVNNQRYLFVQNIPEDKKTLSVINPYDSSIETIIPVKSPFGFNFITKVISFVNFNDASPDNPFGSQMLPFLMFSQQNNNVDMMPLAMMAAMGKNSKIDSKTPLLIAAFSGNKGINNENLLPFLLLKENI